VNLSYVTETWPPELNGVALSAERTVRWLRARGHRVEVVRPRSGADGARRALGGVVGDELLVAGVPLPHYPGLQMGVPAPRRLAARWRSRRPDLVHIATEGPLGGSALAVARWLGIPVTTDYRTHFQQYSGHYGLGVLERVIDRYLRAFHNGGTLTFAPTAALADELAGKGYRNVHAVGRGVDTERFSPRHRCAALRESWGLGDAGLAVLHVGRLAPEKNPRLVLEAWRAMQADAPQARLVWVGDGPLRAELEREVPDAVFAGAQRDAVLAGYYASADVLLFPSTTETFGNVTLEAMASGLAIVAFDCAAAGHHLVDGRSALLAPPRDPAAFVAAARALAQSPALRRVLGREARRAAEALGWPAVLAPFEALLDGCVRRTALDTAERWVRP
jgi:glycosyltransferase involved in cell wall biosynthesis